MDGRLTSGVRRADNVDVLAAHRGCLGYGGAVVHTLSGQRIRARHLETPIVHTGRDDHGMGSQLRAILQSKADHSSMVLNRDDLMSQQELRAEAPSLSHCPARQLGSGKSTRES